MSSFELWSNKDFSVITPDNPHIPYEEGPHLMVTCTRLEAAAWSNPKLAGAAFELGAVASGIMIEAGLTPWVNIQANGNWGLLPGAQPHFHLHLYGRNLTATWGKPIILPEAPGAFNNDPMPRADRRKLRRALLLGL